MRVLTLRVVAVPLVVVLAAAALIAGSAALRVEAADHLDAPTVKTDGRIDINDVYVFEGSNASRTALVMTVNPAAGILSPTTFRKDARYEFRGRHPRQCGRGHHAPRAVRVPARGRLAEDHHPAPGR